jgi:hypothetical protein
MLVESYDPRCQISPSQVEIVASCLRARAPGARMLVFGLGNDTPMWLRLNADGETLFVEHDRSFIDRARVTTPAASVIAYDFGAHTTVMGSFSMSADALESVPMPPEIADGSWDVILVDGPTGYRMGDPGRALPLLWTSRVMSRRTHIFVDDYNRPLERHFADLLVRFDNPPVLELRHDTEPRKLMLWRIGLSLPA